MIDHLGFLRRAAVLLALPALVVAVPKQSAAVGGPYEVQEAEIMEFGSCEVDLWHARYFGRGMVSTVAPACHLFRGVEIGASLSWDRFRGENAFSGGIEAKTMLIRPRPGGIGVAIAAGFGNDFTDRRIGGTFVMLPVTWSPVERLRINANVGWEWDRPEARHDFTYGLGTVFEAHERLHLIGEIFGKSDRSLSMNAGVRPVIVPDRLHLDLVYGRRLRGTPEHRLAVGMTISF